jgi:PKD repeat protein
VIVNGETKLTANIPHDFVPLQVPFQFNSQGSALVTFKYGVASGNAVLFKTLLVQQ